MTRPAVFLRLWPVLLLAAALWGGGATAVHAHGTSPTCTPNGYVSTSTNAGTIIVRPDAKADDPLGDWITIDGQVWNCTGSAKGQTFWFSFVVGGGGTTPLIMPVGRSTTVEGSSYALYDLIQNGTTVVRFIVKHGYEVNGVEKMELANPADNNRSFSHVVQGTAQVVGQQKVRFIKHDVGQLEGSFTFQVANRTVSLSKHALHGTSEFAKRAAKLTVNFETLNQPCNVVVPQKVDLGTVFAHEIPNIGNVASKSTPFDIEFKDCPVGYNSVRYRFEPDGASPRAGTLPLLAASEASGVGVEVRDSHDATLFFTQDFKYILTQYRSNPGQTLYKVPLKARFIRTAQEVTPGQAQARLRLYVQYN